MGFLKIDINKDRVYGLDILRALAILFVVYGHTVHFLLKVWPERWLTLAVFDGVSIFFVLSGFLIGGILIRTLERRPPTTSVLLNFWIRRWFRTLPNYFLILILLFIGQGLILEKTTFSESWNYLFFVQNFQSVHPNFFPEAWSLSIEEWFYLLLPIGLYTMIKLKVPVKQSFLIAIVAFLGYSLFIRYFRFIEMEDISFKLWDNVFRKQVITRLDSLMFGVLGAWVSHYYFKHWTKHKLKLLVIGILLMIGHKLLMHHRVGLGLSFNMYFCVFSFSLISVATLSMLPFLSNYKNGKGRRFRILTVVSLISYSMYLINLTPVQEVFLRALYKIIPAESSSAMSLFYFALAWFTTIVGSIIIYKYFEIPMTRLREKYDLKTIQNWFKKTP